MKDRIAILCPSRGRPGSSTEVQESYSNFSETSDLFFVLDEDDYPNYPVLDGANYLIYPHVNMGFALNSAAKELMHDYSYLYFMGDDHRFRTKGWDTRFIQAAKGIGGVAVVYGNDLLQGPTMATECMLTSNIVQALGYMVLPELWHLWFDIWWLEIGRGLNKLVYLHDVIIEHMHYCVGKSKIDDNYRRVNDPSFENHDAQVFREWLPSKEQTIQKIRDYCKI